MLAVAATFLTGVTSCSSDDNVSGGNLPEQSAKLNISISTPTHTRAVGASTPEDKVDNFTVFITNQADVILTKAYSGDGANLIGDKAVPTSTEAKNVYVVANSGNLTSIDSKADLDAYLADLNGTGSQASARWATGKTATPLAFTQSGDVFSADASIELTFIAARITLKIENGMTGYNPANTDGSLVLKNVAVLNARGQSKLFGQSLIPTAYEAGKKFYTGLENVSFANFPATADYTVSNLLIDAIPANDFAKVYTYYVFENDAETVEEFPTIITIVGEFDGKAVYYPVHLAPYEKWISGTNTEGKEFIKRGYSYNINIKLTVDPTKEGGNPGGGTDPTTPLVDAKVNVTVTLNDWIPVELGKEF